VPRNYAEALFLQVNHRAKAGVRKRLMPGKSLRQSGGSTVEDSNFTTIAGERKPIRSTGDEKATGKDGSPH